jgi:hypothetical protein
MYKLNEVPITYPNEGRGSSLDTHHILTMDALASGSSRESRLSQSVEMTFS